MIKISKENETLPLAFNPNLNQNFIENVNIHFDLENKILSFNQISKIFAYFKPNKHIQILLIPRESYSDLLTDMAALRMYDSSFKKEDKEIAVNGEFGKLYVTYNNKLKNCAFLLEVEGLELLEETIIINTEDFEFKKNKDLSKIELKFKNIYKINNIGKR